VAEINAPGLSVADVQAIISSAMAAQSTSFINGGNEQTVAQLLTNFPADASMLFKYARVSDLFGQTRSVMICEGSAGQYYWRPQRTDYSATSAVATGGMTLTPLLSAPTIAFTGTLTGNVTVTPSITNVWPGAQFTVIANGVLGLFGINIAGLVGGGVIPLLGGSARTMTYVQGAGWRAG
jgi:hypothetical protein